MKSQLTFNEVIEALETLKPLTVNTEKEYKAGAQEIVAIFYGSQENLDDVIQTVNDWYRLAKDEEEACGPNWGQEWPQLIEAVQEMFEL